MIWQTLLGILLVVLGLFLILIVLVQRGRGGGLAGALGGAGGQSAFGTKAGDTFTRITIVTAGAWILLCILSIKMMGSGTNRFNTTGGGDNTPRSIAPLSTEDSTDPATPPATGTTPSGGESTAPDTPASSEE
jgi:preprotein translocase subunit SecG